MSVNPIVLAAVVRTLDPHFAGERCDVRVTLDPHPKQPGNVLVPGTELRVRPEDVEAMGIVPGSEMMLAFGPLALAGEPADAPVDDQSEKIEALQAAVDGAHGALSDKDAMIANLRASVDDLMAQRDQAVVEADELRAEVEKMRTPTPPPIPAETPPAA